MVPTLLSMAKHSTYPDGETMSRPHRVATWLLYSQAEQIELLQEARAADRARLGLQPQLHEEQYLQSEQEERYRKYQQARWLRWARDGLTLWTWQNWLRPGAGRSAAARHHIREM